MEAVASGSEDMSNVGGGVEEDEVIKPHPPSEVPLEQVTGTKNAVNP